MAKDARGHGSERRGGKVRVSVDPSKLGHRIADIGPGGVEHNVQTGGAWGADHEAARQLAMGNPKADAAPVHPGTNGPQYNRGAVDNAIASSNRAGRRIGGREAKAIHALLRGRH